MLKSMRNEKNTLRKTPFFSLLFCSRFWEGLGRVLGGFCKGFGDFWGLLGQFLASFFEACIQNALQKGSWKVLSWILAPFWKVLRWILAPFWKVLSWILAPYMWIIWAYCFGAHVCVFLRILTCMLITSTFCFGAKSKIIENPNASLEQNSRPTMPFRLMAVLHCLRTSELSVKLLRIR